MQRMIEGGVLADIILTSPPYNNSTDVHSRGNIDNYVCRYDIYNDTKSESEYIDWSVDLFNQYNKVLKDNGVILYNISYGTSNPTSLWRLISNLIDRTDFVVADCIIWKKNSALPNNNNPNKLTRFTEFVFVFCRKSEYGTYRSSKIPKVNKMGQVKYTCFSNFIEAENNDGPNDFNKATFSVSLCMQLFERYAYDKGLLVYDSFMGTGTTAVASVKFGLNYIGSELSENQCNYANDRINKIYSIPTSGKSKKLF